MHVKPFLHAQHPLTLLTRKCIDMASHTACSKSVEPSFPVNTVTSWWQHGGGRCAV